MRTKYYGYVYRITNNINGKTYIGRHKYISDEAWESYLGSGTLIKNSVNYYGRENFTKTLIEECEILKELIEKEKYYIALEVSSGKSEYNIAEANNNLQIHLSSLNINGEEVLEWYFTEELSWNEIAAKLSCSASAIFTYIKNSYGDDERFKRMKEDPTFRVIKYTAKNKNIVNCEYCDKRVKLMGLRVHLQYCLKEKNVCSESNCPIILSKASAKYCKIHYYETTDFKEYSKRFTVEGTRRGALAAAHKRMHVKEGIYIEFCEYCKEYCEENELELTVTKEKLIEFKELNYSNMKIAEIFKVNKSTISNWLKLIGE